MKRLLRNTLLLGVAAISLKGCIFSPKVGEPPPTGGVYSAPTAPESLVANLQVSYRRREIIEYAKILAPEFIFKFQPVDAATIEKEFWTRDEDSTGTGKLFHATEVTAIRIDLLHGDVEPANELNMPPGAMKIRIIQTDLQVDAGDITYMVTDQQDMFFRRGLVDAGEDTTRWFLFEWRDLPKLAAPGLVPQSLSTATSSPQTLESSWGGLVQDVSKTD